MKPTSDRQFLQFIGDRIRLARKQKGINQEDLARLVGKTQDAISDYEQGNRAMRIVDLPRIAEALDVPMAYFFGSEVLEYDTLSGVRTWVEANRGDIVDRISAIQRLSSSNQNTFDNWASAELWSSLKELSDVLFIGVTEIYLAHSKSIEETETPGQEVTVPSVRPALEAEKKIDEILEGRLYQVLLEITEEMHKDLVFRLKQRLDRNR